MQRDIGTTIGEGSCNDATQFAGCACHQCDLADKSCVREVIMIDSVAWSRFKRLNFCTVYPVVAAFKLLTDMNI
jgi:hypothetical protein